MNLNQVSPSDGMIYFNFFFQIYRIQSTVASKPRNLKFAQIFRLSGC